MGHPLESAGPHEAPRELSGGACRQFQAGVERDEPPPEARVDAVGIFGELQPGHPFDRPGHLPERPVTDLIPATLTGAGMEEPPITLEVEADLRPGEVESKTSSGRMDPELPDRLGVAAGPEELKEAVLQPTLGRRPGPNLFGDDLPKELGTAPAARRSPLNEPHETGQCRDPATEHVVDRPGRPTGRDRRQLQQHLRRHRHRDHSDLRSLKPARAVGGNTFEMGSPSGVDADFDLRITLESPEPEEPGSRAVRCHAPARQASRQNGLLVTGLDGWDSIHTSVPRQQLPKTDPAIDLAGREPRRQELRPRDEAVLADGDASDNDIHWVHGTKPTIPV